MFYVANGCRDRDVLTMMPPDLTNRNTIVRDAWSSARSHQRYLEQWPDEPTVRTRYDNGEQCGGCAFFAPFNYDWGLCCHPASRHLTETVFEHFTCPAYEHEGWGPHSFRNRAQRALLDDLFGDAG
jgi:hypothetical protein